MIIFVIIATLFFMLGIPYLISSAVDPIGTSKVIDSIFKKEKKYDVQDEMSFFNDAEWVKKVILSCKTTAQVWNAYELSKILRKKYEGKVEKRAIWLASDEISKLFDKCYDELVYSRK